MFRKGHLKRETKSLRKAAPYNAIMTTHIKASIGKDTTKQKEYKTRHEWEGKVIPWELCKKLKFDHTNKWDTHYPEYVQENERHKLLCDFEIQTNPLISTR